MFYDEGMKETSVILSVAVPSPLRKALDYLPPAGSGCVWQPGQRLTVPLGSRKVTGVLVAVKSESDFELAKLKAAVVCHDETALWSPPLLQLFRWAAEYYRYPIGAAFAEVLPSALRQGNTATLEPAIYYQLTDQGRASLAVPANRAPKQRLLLELLAAQGEVQPEQLTGKAALVKALLDKAQIEKKERLPEAWSYQAERSTLQLNVEQQCAVDAIQQASGFAPFLLCGVTGSGKTEVYFRAMKAALAQGKQVLFLVPEIALTPQTLSRIQRAFSVPVVAYHSGLTDKSRLQAWQLAQTGLAAIVVGTRSAVFLPLKNPGIIVVDEEHDGSYKQQSGFRYNARDCAVRRAQLESLPIILGSATPSLRSYNNALKGRYQLLTLSKPAVAAEPAKRRCLQLSAKNYQQGISDELKQIIESHLQQKKQVLLFLNRRGFAPLYLCPACQYTAQCHQCDANLTYHQYKNSLVCHHCDSKQYAMKNCPSCKRAEMIPYGLGTEQLEHTAKELFPKQRVLRIDRDTTLKRGELEKQLQAIDDGEVDIIIGTQMLAKGHHFANLTCVVVVNADQGFLSSDFRSAEQTAALLEQVAGRAGRELDAGEVILQTLQPDNPYLKTLLSDGYLVLAKQLLEERQAAGLPPAAAMALLAVESQHAGAAEQFLLAIRRFFNGKDWQWMGPMPALLAKRANWHRFQLGLLSPSSPQLQQQLQQLVSHLDQQKNNRVRWFLDVDPYSLM
jgi:primosomal protein N' (replication factor Y)